MPVSIQQAREQKSEAPVLIIRMDKKLRLDFRMACMEKGVTMRDAITQMVEKYITKAKHRKRT